jgi:hypothetical protein
MQFQAPIFCRKITPAAFSVLAIVARAALTEGANE